MFYLLSLITGILECGWIAFGAIHSFPLWQVLCFPLAYHIGNLFPVPFSLNRSILISIGGISVFTSAVTTCPNQSSDTIFWLTCISLFCISTVLQSVRSGLKCEGNRLLKRIFRVIGFAVAPVAAVVPSVVLTLASLIALYSIKYYNYKCKIAHLTKQDGFSVVMVFHQLHYFFYAHITLASICNLFIIANGITGILLAMLLFCGTWITYMIVEPTLTALTAKNLAVFYTGHIGISLLLSAMSTIGNSLLFIVLWLVTGFGGGVVYTISAQAKVMGLYRKDSMTMAENIGHTIGLLTATVISGLFETSSLNIMLIFGAVSASLSVLCMILTLRKEGTV